MAHLFACSKSTLGRRQGALGFFLSGLMSRCKMEFLPFVFRFLDKERGLEEHIFVVLDCCTGGNGSVKEILSLVL